MTEVTDRPFKVGDKVYVRYLDDMPEHEHENWAVIYSHLKLDTEYTVLKVVNNKNEISGDSECSWIRVSDDGYIHHPSRFVLSSERNQITIGTKSMPQVISNCDIGDIEKSIFQAVADKKKTDVYVYDMKGIYHDHPTSSTYGIHLYFNCLSAYFYAKSEGAVARLSQPGDDAYRGYIKDCIGGRINTTIPMLNGDLIYTRGIAMFINGDFIHSCENSKEDYNRIQYLLFIINQQFSVSNVNLDEILADSLIDGAIQQKSVIIEQRNQSRIEDLMNSIVGHERSITLMHREIQELSHIRYDYSDEKSDMIANIKRLPNIVSVSINMVEGHLYIIVKTKPLIVHLPHGDIPCGSITITIKWLYDPVVVITGEYAKFFHPHYKENPCWGGFDSMITKLLALNDFDTLIEIIIQWHGAYDGSGVFKPWHHRLQQKEVGIIIEEGFYISGEGEDE